MSATATTRRPRATPAQVAERAECAARKAKAKLERAQYEAQAKLMAAAGSIAEDYARTSSYSGAGQHRTMDDWIATNASPDQDLAYGQRERIVARARDLYRNTTLGRALVEAQVRQDIGRGMTPRPTLDHERLGIEALEADELSDLIQDEWQSFAGEAAADERGDFYTQQQQVARSMSVDGELTSRIVQVNRPGRRFMTAIELCEQDRIQTPDKLANDAQLRDGVVLGKSGQAIAYWMLPKHPGDLLFDSQAEHDFRRVPVWASAGTGMRICAMAANRIRPGQTRGESRFAPVLTDLRHVEKFHEAELVAKRVESCIIGFIETGGGQPSFGGVGAGTQAQVNQQRGTDKIPWEPGTITRLRSGEKPHMHSPTRPGGGYPEFMLLSLRRVCAAFGFPIEVVLLDWHESNYSNARAAILESRRASESRRRDIVREHSQIGYEAFLEELWLSGRLPPFVRDFYRDRRLLASCLWVPHGWQWVDPAKEGQSTVLQLENGLTNPQIECDELDRPWKSVRRGRIEAMLFDEAEEARQRKARNQPKPAAAAAPTAKGETDEQGAPEGEPAEEPEAASV